MTVYRENKYLLCVQSIRYCQNSFWKRDVCFTFARCQTQSRHSCTRGALIQNLSRASRWSGKKIAAARLPAKRIGHHGIETCGDSNSVTPFLKKGTTFAVLLPRNNASFRGLTCTSKNAHQPKEKARRSQFEMSVWSV